MMFMGLSANKSVYQVVREAADRVRGISVQSINPGVTVTPIHGGMTVTPISGVGSIVSAIRRGADRAMQPFMTSEQIAENLSKRHGMNGLGLDYGYTRGMFGGLGVADSGITTGLTLLGLLGASALILAVTAHKPKRRRR